MKEQEAKDWLKVLGGTLNNGDKRVEAVEMGIKALEKQIAKKPIYKPYDDTCVYYEYACPDCEEWLDRNSKPHHCKCGQKILWDWGNEDAE